MKLVLILVGALAAAGILAWHALFGGDPSRRTHVTGDLFTDVTATSGVTFRFHGDFMDGKLIPTMGGGVAVADMDGDGFPDLFFVQQVKSASRYRKHGRAQPIAECGKLFRNRGDGTFADVTKASGIEACGWGVGAMWADLDADGDADLVVGNVGEPNRLYRNDGSGRFTWIQGSGLESGLFTIGLAALDADGDGKADVYVGHYLETDSERESKTPAKAFMTPDQYDGQPNNLYRATGELSYADVTSESGTADPGSKTIGAVALDYDGDGRTDLFLSNDQWRNTLFHNEGGGRFRDVSDETGTGYPQEGPTAFGRRTRSGMGLIGQDLDGDGRPDLFVTNYSGEPNTLLRNVEGSVFEQAERQAFGGENDPSIPLSGWGTVALDYDDDGADDIAVSNGQILSRFWTAIAQLFNPVAKNFAVGEKSYAQRQFLFRNEGKPGEMRFRDVSAEAGDLGRLSIVGRGLAAADLDGDGRLDLVFNPIAHPAVLLRNTGKGGRSIEILPVAGDDRKTVLGAVVTVAGRKREHFVIPSYAGGSWLPLHFGIGASASAPVTVRWPDGTSADLGEVPAGAYRIRKGGSLEPLRGGRAN